MAMAVGAFARLALLLRRTTDTVPWSLCSDNRLGVLETTLPVKTQGRTLDCPFNFRPPRASGWLLMCRCQVCQSAPGGALNTTLRVGSPW